MLVVFTAGDWPSQYSQKWSQLAVTLGFGVEIYAYGIKPGAQREQLENITRFNGGSSYLLDDYILPTSNSTAVGM